LSAVASTMTAGTAAGTYDAVLITVPFPARATMRAVAMNGYFTQTSLGLGRYTASVVKEVTGDSKRRAIVKFTGCLDCHEELRMHGGGRVLAAATNPSSPPVCTMCHNPNLSSSGNTFNIATYVPGSNVDSDATIATYGDDPFAWPEATQNFKDLVHGIHGAGVRDTRFEHVRVRGGNAYGYDWSHATFPADPSNCSKCHVGDSYMPNKIPANALMSTNVTGAPTTRAQALAVRTTVPNDEDEVIRPVVSACYGCHNSGLVMAHMNQNGAMLGTSRATIATSGMATCVLCHDSGSLADVSKMHSGLNP
jgi:OmcA/MtrC family decaheme c-type cytochrome